MYIIPLHQPVYLLDLNFFVEVLLTTVVIDGCEILTEDSIVVLSLCFGSTLTVSTEPSVLPFISCFSTPSVEGPVAPYSQ